MPTFPQHRLKNSEFRKEPNKNEQKPQQIELSNLYKNSKNVRSSSKSNANANISSKILVNVSKSASKTNNISGQKRSPDNQLRSRSVSTGGGSIDVVKRQKI